MTAGTSPEISSAIAVLGEPETTAGARSRGWFACASAVLVLHALAAWLVLHSRRPPAEPPGAPDAVLIELAPVTVAPVQSPAAPSAEPAPADPPAPEEARPETTPDPAPLAQPEAANPAPPRPETQATEAPSQAPEAVPVAPEPPVEMATPPASQVTNPAAVLPAPPRRPPPASPKPPPRPIARPKPAPTKPVAQPIRRPPVERVERRPVGSTQAHGAARAASSRAAAQATGRTGAAVADPAAVASWRAQLVAHLNRFKHFPPGAGTGAGVASVRFTIGRSGQVLSASLAGSSGDGSLDQEAVAMVRRASPVPALPAGLGASVALSVPVRFNR